jgi:FkbM family methyltransferase
MKEKSKQQINALIKKYLNPFLTKKIIRLLVNIPSYLLTDNLIIFLKENNYTPSLVLDIGSNHGRWTRKWAHAFKNAKFIMVEPQSWLQNSFRDLIKNDNIKFINAGVGKENGCLDFTINTIRDDSSTFLMSEKEAECKGFKQIKVDVLTINEIIKRNNGFVPDVIKIDAEGLDLQVLQGADLAFGITDIFLVEASINNFNSDNNILNLITFMDHRGYKVFDFTELNRPFSHNGLWQVEIVFVKKELFNFMK